VVLAAFLVGLALTICATALAVVRGIALWRNAKRTGATFSAELSSFEERAARTERLLAEAERSSQDLDAAIARFRVSRARLDVLVGSLETAQRRMRWLRVLLPLR
jgi:exonuclease VII small subunit